MISHAKTARNWELWRAYRTGNLTQKEVAARFGLTGSRVADICNKIDRHLANALINGAAAGEQGRDARANLTEVHLQLSDTLPYGAKHPAKPWRQFPDTIHNLWTFERISGTAEKYYRIVPDSASATLSMVKPDGFAEKPLVETPAPPINGLTKVLDLPLSARTRHCLKNEGYETLAELLALDDPALEALLKAQNFGRKSLRELREFLAHLKGQVEVADPADLERRLEQAQTAIADLRAKVREQDAALKREYAFVAKLRNILAKLTKEMTVGELREAGISIDLRVAKD